MIERGRSGKVGKVCTRIRLETIMGIPSPNFPSETMIPWKKGEERRYVRNGS